MTEDSETLFLDLANNFPEAEDSQTQHKESAPKKYTGRDQVVQ